MYRRIPGAEGLYAIWNLAWVGSHHLLVHNQEAVLLDTGLCGEIGTVRYLLKHLNLEPENLKAILLTHGHLDHTGNLAYWVEQYGIPVYGHAAEQDHVNGNYPYKGINRICGWMESVGQTIFRYRPAHITHTIQEGDELPFWGGLHVVHLPGHTAGHCGYYSEKNNLLFSGDLFSSYYGNINCPPPFLNSQPELLKSSLDRVRTLNPSLIVPNHYEICDPNVHRERFHRRFPQRLKKKKV